jgi:hypothetical protein
MDRAEHFRGAVRLSLIVQIDPESGKRLCSELSRQGVHLVDSFCKRRDRFFLTASNIISALEWGGSVQTKCLFADQIKEGDFKSFRVFRHIKSKLSPGAW